MSEGKLLLVEDDPSLAELLEFRFEKEGYTVRVTPDGDEALVMAREELPDLVVLDWMLEGTSGIEVCRQLRRDKATAHVPVIMLTAREAEDDRIRGLETGADDYVTKPFSPRELVARVAAVMRRIRPALAGEEITVGDITLDPNAFRVTRAGADVQIGPTEYRLLKFFMERPGRVFSRDQLLDGVWGAESDIELRTVDVHIRRLRKTLEGEGLSDPIRTVRSAGYALEAPAR
ncbi:Alkaline phosphatase synthesis transcriptional regulatory protein PhoP [Alteripontixanthobacter maritimus]|uniref:Phosphate regulon transcriptional regulatory protein PhoB n=1 Tax=Alteripontixanthobacter maritimus TaxID=2161824 RepID=A0A369Q516_9SPHN|nr:phosphate regulon transcriptional regulator PhoB [Alteripontixanthobacter maritimus]RDC59824.1 Alkaline phosphatase synthesis transcriptional regulatory protein PhoP [Alteripontixanthobacter maritimus]